MLGFQNFIEIWLFQTKKPIVGSTQELDFVSYSNDSYAASPWISHFKKHWVNKQAKLELVQKVKKNNKNKTPILLNFVKLVNTSTEWGLKLSVN